MEIKQGDIVNGIVKNIKPYGAFIEIENGKTGLLPIKDISVARMKNPSEKLKIGQEIGVVIKSIEKEKNRLFLSHKELLGTWEENVKEIEEGSIIKGIIKETDKNGTGIFIELKPNLIGMAEYNDSCSYGEQVDVYVKKIIPKKKKIKLKIV